RSARAGVQLDSQGGRDRQGHVDVSQPQRSPRRARRDREYDEKPREKCAPQDRPRLHAVALPRGAQGRVAQVTRSARGSGNTLGPREYYAGPNRCIVADVKVRLATALCTATLIAGSACSPPAPPAPVTHGPPA